MRARAAGPLTLRPGPPPPVATGEVPGPAALAKPMPVTFQCQTLTPLSP